MTAAASFAAGNCCFRQTHTYTLKWCLSRHTSFMRLLCCPKLCHIFADNDRATAICHVIYRISSGVPQARQYMYVCAHTQTCAHIVTACKKIGSVVGCKQRSLLLVYKYRILWSHKTGLRLSSTHTLVQELCVSIHMYIHSWALAYAYCQWQLVTNRLRELRWLLCAPVCVWA